MIGCKLPPEASKGPISGWSDEELRHNAEMNFGLGSDANLSSDIRFRVGVVRAIRERRLNAGEEDGDLLPAIFLLAPPGPETDGAWNTESIPMLDTGLKELAGFFWFVGPAVRLGHRILQKEYAADEAEAFGAVVTTFGLGGVPAIVVEHRSSAPQARFYPEGLECPDTVEVLRLGDEPIEMPAILAVIDAVHEKQLVTPSVQGTTCSLWAEPSKSWPVSDAEKQIQGVLRSALQGAYPGTTVREEETQATGRLDLEIGEQQPGRNVLVRHALLELKVLRAFRESGFVVPKKEVATAVKDGMDQVLSYRDERQVKAAALCCFDMRAEVTGDDCFSGHKKRASDTELFLRAWHLFNTAKAYRNFLNADPVSIA
jgi:hypothetical protein